MRLSLLSFTRFSLALITNVNTLLSGVTFCCVEIEIRRIQKPCDVCSLERLRSLCSSLKVSTSCKSLYLLCPELRVDVLGRTTCPLFLSTLSASLRAWPDSSPPVTPSPTSPSHQPPYSSSNDGAEEDSCCFPQPANWSPSSSSPSCSATPKEAVLTQNPMPQLRSPFSSSSSYPLELEC